MSIETLENATVSRTATARFFSILGDPTRLAILELLLEAPCSVSELVNSLGMSQGRVSNHLACLRWCEFVKFEKVGRRVIYRVSDARVAELMAMAGLLSAEHCEHLASCARIGPDWL